MNIDYKYMRPLKCERLKEMHDSNFLLRTDLKSILLPNAVILPAKKDGTNLFGLGGVITSEGEYVIISGIKNRFGGYYETENFELRDEKVVYCGYLVNQWGHFLIESVARLWFFLKNDVEIDKYIFVGDLGKDYTLKGNYKEFFELLGIAEKVEIISRPMQFREVIVPELGYKRMEYYSDEYRAIFAKVRENALTRIFTCEVKEKVFLSRRWFADKTEVGVDMLDDFFFSNNYHVLYPEKVSLAEMIYYLDNAKICAAESGTLPHNFLFASDQKDIVIIERQDTLNEVQVDIDRIKDNSVTYVDGYYTIYPVGAGFGPYYLAYNNYMKLFAENNNMCSPDSYYFKEKYKRYCLKKYMKIYKANHGYQWAFEKWQLVYCDVFFEAYAETKEDLGEYLSQNKMFRISQLTDVALLKQITRKILKQFLVCGK